MTDATDSKEYLGVVNKELSERVHHLEHELGLVRRELHNQRVETLTHRLFIDSMKGAATMEQLIAVITAQLKRIAHAERVTLYLRDARGRLASKIKDGSGEIVLAPGQGIAGTVAQTGKPLLENDPYQNALFDPTWDRKSGYTTRNMVVIPIKDPDGAMLGIIQMINKLGPNEEAEAFSEEDLQKLVGYAELLHFLIESLQNKNLVEAYEKRHGALDG